MITYIYVVSVIRATNPTDLESYEKVFGLLGLRDEHLPYALRYEPKSGFMRARLSMLSNHTIERVAYNRTRSALLANNRLKPPHLLGHVFDVVHWVFPSLEAISELTGPPPTSAYLKTIMRSVNLSEAFRCATDDMLANVIVAFTTSCKFHPLSNSQEAQKEFHERQIEFLRVVFGLLFDPDTRAVGCRNSGDRNFCFCILMCWGDKTTVKHVWSTSSPRMQLKVKLSLE